MWECGGVQEAVRTTMLPANESERRERKDGLALRPFSLTLERFEFERFESRFKSFKGGEEGSPSTREARYAASFWPPGYSRAPRGDICANRCAKAG